MRTIVDQSKLMDLIRGMNKALLQTGKTWDEAYKTMEPRLELVDKSLLTEFLRELTAPWDAKEKAEREAARPKTSSVVPTWKPERPEPVEEKFESTLDLELNDRLDCIIDFMKTTRRTNYTRDQIETGAGYRRADIRLSPEDYKSLKRRVQRDLEYLEKNGYIIHEEKDQPKGVHGGFKNKLHLYSLAFDPEDDQDDIKFYASLRYKVLAALDALDTRDMDKFVEQLEGALDALDMEN
jgi:hypothetical protein